MIELGLWFIPEPLSPQDLTYPDPMHEDMVHPFKIRRSVLNQLIKRDPIYKDMEEQKVANQIWEIIEDQEDIPDSDE